MTRLYLATAIALLPATAFAETQIERLERLSEEMNGVVPIMMANEIEAQGGDGAALRAVANEMPDWNDAMRAAGECMIDRYTAASSSADIDMMLDNMEALLGDMESMQMTEFAESDMSNDMLPPGVTLEQSATITQDCGMMDLQMEAMQNSGFMEAMMAASATMGN
jgi:hypothetical protein